jgi:ketosteroid isomerase-like protein
MQTRILATMLSLALSLAAGAFGSAGAQDSRQADHDALRALRAGMTKAINTRDFEGLASALAKEFVLTTVDQQTFRSIAQFRSYWDGLFQGERAVLRRVTVNPEADELTRFVSSEVGIVHGASTDTYEFTDGDTRVMKVRWSAVVQKLDGQWKLVSVHVGTNLFDNPVLDAAKGRARMVAAGALAAGLALGGVVGFLGGRRRARAA